MSINYSVDVILFSNRVLEIIIPLNRWVEKEELEELIKSSRALNYVVDYHRGFIIDDTLNYLVLNDALDQKHEDGKIFYKKMGELSTKGWKMIPITPLTQEDIRSNAILSHSEYQELCKEMGMFGITNEQCEKYGIPYGEGFIVVNNGDPVLERRINQVESE